MLKQLAAGAVLGALCVQALLLTTQGRKAYWQQVNPVVSQYREAISWQE